VPDPEYVVRSPNPTAAPTIVAYTHLGWIAGSLAKQELFACSACHAIVAVPGGQALVEEAPEPLEAHANWHAEQGDG
jgi:hypothetical protein